MVILKNVLSLPMKLLNTNKYMADNERFEIKDGVLVKCKNWEIQEAVIPDSVTKIGEDAFWGCDSLESIEIPDSVTEIGEGAFWGCRSLKSVEIPDSVVKIGEMAFEDCSNLQSVAIPDSVTEIEKAAFSCCWSLKSIEIPNSVVKIGEEAFWDCESLCNISVAPENPSFKDIDGVLYSKDGRVLIKYPESKEGDSYVIPDGVTEIGDGAFWGCKSLKSIEIPRDCKLDNRAFAEDVKIKRR